MDNSSVFESFFYFMAEDKVSNLHSSYYAASRTRKIFKDVISGTLAMRSDENRKTYLPQFPREDDDSYKVRAETATLLNITEKTKKMMVGLVFEKDVTFGDDVPIQIKGDDGISGLIENIDNKGNHFNVFFREQFDRSFEGHSIILVDSPNIESVKSQGDVQRLGLRPYCVAYDADALINWDWRINPISKSFQWTLFVFKECVSKTTGRFTKEDVTQYRVWFLDENNQVAWELWEETEKDDKGKQMPKTEVMIDEGKVPRLSELPVKIIYSKKLKDGESVPSLMDLALKNIEHFQTYSDYKSLIHKTCVPMFYTKGLDASKKGDVAGDMHWKLPAEGDIGWTEVTGSSLSTTRQSLEDIKDEMSILGLSMLASKPAVQQTATETMLDSIQETSDLQEHASSLKDVIEGVLNLFGQYLGLGKDNGGSVELGANWAQMVLSDAEITVQSQLVTDGNFSQLGFLWNMEKAGKLRPDVTAEDEQLQINKEQKAKQNTNAGLVNPPVNQGDMHIN